MVRSVVAGKLDDLTPSNMVELGDGRLNVEPVSRCYEAKSRSAPKKKYLEITAGSGCALFDARRNTRRVRRIERESTQRRRR
ncbi:hypothetical protein EVAR_46018_1 [Eumeta japonica]|uniref:Uncharacterized protein n=1 Tax=Eumeta variegata TaxID=151549 RepID=A0A4C1Z875_EUMVA|nr:hypothetical protein EVAR_46018_1 [Eumeta japonica]